jgi:hypothetical protein
MSQLGKSPVQNLLSWSPKKKGWYPKTIVSLMQRIVNDIWKCNEILEGCSAIADGASISATTLNVTTTGALRCKLNGRLMAALAILDDADLLADVGTPIWSDGSPVEAFELGAGEDVTVTLIVTNSDDAGDVDEDDAGTPLLVPVLSGTAAAYTGGLDQLSSYEIQSALEASDEHAGVTGWAHVLQAVFTEDTGVTGAYVLNRNNVVSEA